VHAEHPELACVLIPKNRPADPETFYMSENMITNETFAKFADANTEKVKDSQWTLGAIAAGGDLGVENGKLPVMRVTVTEAHECARWLAGFLPTRKQWDKAAGLYDATDAQGPFKGTWNQQQPPEGVSLGRGMQGPMEAGEAPNDVSIFGCRDMAGNGREWTRDIAGIEGQSVPTATPVTSPDRVIVTLRSKSYIPPAPVTFQGLKDPDSFEIEMQDYVEAHPQTGFRIVVERTN
jgi:formylglycine-generating enzyme required for sulfatase activity